MRNGLVAGFVLLLGVITWTQSDGVATVLVDDVSGATTVSSTVDGVASATSFLNVSLDGEAGASYSDDDDDDDFWESWFEWDDDDDDDDEYEWEDDD